MSRDTSGSAFPLALGWIETDQNNGNQKTVDVRDVEHGLSVRDYFAAKALAAIIGHPNKEPENCGSKAVPRLAAWAYEYADAMLAARVKP